MRRIIKSIFLFLVFLSFLALKVHSQGFGNGQEGSVNLSGEINEATYLVKDAPKCTDTLYVKNTSGFYPEDLILIMQMEGAIILGDNIASYGEVIDYNGAGQYEMAQVKSVGSGFIEIEYALQNFFSSKNHTQIIRVPQYQDILVSSVLTCPKWNGYTGGVLVLNALNEIELQADIDVSSKGYRGGNHHTAPHFFGIEYDYVAESPDPAFYARKGEGIAGFGIDSMTSARGAPANGGGGANIHTSGGGGGASFGKGGDGGWGYPVDGSGGEKTIFGIGGHAIDYMHLHAYVFMGGGGGAGHEHFGNGSSGAAGGGIVLIFASSLNAKGHKIVADGASSGSSGAFGDGAGGAGGAGAVMLHLDTLLNSLTVELNGGHGGNTIGQGFGVGGGGAGGLLLLNSNLPDVVEYNGGNNGLAGGTYYGGSKGQAGGIIQDTFSIPFNQKYHRVYADFSIDPAHLLENGDAIISNKLLQFNNSSRGGTNSFWLFGDGQQSEQHSPQHQYPGIGYYHVALIESNQLCADTAERYLKPVIELPNIFTPNQDGHNELFPGIKIDALETITIRSRWGQIVFVGNQSYYNWDGTSLGEDMPAGVYEYSIRLLDEAGNTYIMSGNVTLVR